MKPFSALIFAFVALALTFDGTNAGCTTSFTNPYSYPKMIVHFGTKHLLREMSSVLTADTYEKVELYCKHGFSSSRYGSIQQTRMEMECVPNSFRTSIPGFEYPDDIGCMGPQSVQMYESLTKLPECEKEMTLVVGDDFQELGSLKTLAICYDILKEKVKYVAYTAYPSKIKMIQKTQIGQLNRLGLDVDASSTARMFNAVSTSDILGALKKDKQLKQLFGDETFEYANLIQDNAFKSDFDESSSIDKMLSIVWLRALRSGNWRHLLNALEVANLNGKYDVRVGTSGVIKLPTMQNCSENQQMILELENGNIITVPSHIWAHIRNVEASINATDQFVVIAHNSPFVNNDQRQQLCNSMCHEVAWLKDSLFMKLQHYPIYGSVQCCRVPDVADKLDNFPNTIELPPPHIPTYQLNNPPILPSSSSDSGIDPELL